MNFFIVYILKINIISIKILIYYKIKVHILKKRSRIYKNNLAKLLLKYNIKLKDN